MNSISNIQQGITNNQVINKVQGHINYQRISMYIGFRWMLVIPCWILVIDLGAGWWDGLPALHSPINPSKIEASPAYGEAVINR